MSYDPSDAQWDAMMDAASEALYPEHFERAVQEFTTDRLQSYYMAHRDVARAALSALSKARALLPDHPEAAFVFAAIAAEVGLRAAVLRPITHGLVHNENLADAVAKLLTETRPSLAMLETLSIRILAEHGGIDLGKDRRPGATEPLWSEMKGLNTVRNRVLHEAAPLYLSNAKQAVAIAEYFLEVVFPNVLARLELNLGPDRLVSCDTGCQWPLRGRYRLDAGRIYGPCAGGQYAVADDGRLLKGLSDTGFYIADGRLYGPERRPPWVQAREELAALLKAARESMRPPAERTDALRRFVHALFTSHVLAYDAVDDGTADAFGIVTTAAGAFLVGGHTDWRSAPVAAIRAFEDAARARNIGGVYVSLALDPSAFSLAPTSTEIPTVLVDAEELQGIAEGRTLLSAMLDRKAVAARAGHMYVPVR